MSVALEHLHRFGLKLFLRPDTQIDPAACIPVFHRWIRERTLEGLLIDVADYTHLEGGPRVLLVGHDGNLFLDFSDRRVGLSYTRKRPDASAFDARLVCAGRTLLTACQLLEEEPTFTYRLQFVGNELQFVSNDRLVAPSEALVAARLGEGLKPFLGRLYGDMPYEMTNISTDHGRLRLIAKTSAAISVETLRSRIA